MPGQSKKEKVVIVGTGWAGWTLSQELNEELFDLVVISPQRTLALTPLLASAACGIL
jgi:NADH:ubiquinone reductase (non-electrogenic)